MFRFILLAIAAAMWCATPPVHAQPYKAVLLHPISGFKVSRASDVTAGTQVGTGSNNQAIGPSDEHALLWRGARESVVDLQPPGFTVTNARGASENHQVGHGRGPATNGLTHALLWAGTAESVIDLHPAGFRISYATDVVGNTQGGYGTNPGTHALLWRGTAESVVDLHPIGFGESQVLGLSESTQVGHGYVNTPGLPYHALLWRGSADSAVDLHPAGFRNSSARAAWGDIQVGDGRGWGNDLYETHALLWRGSAESVIDLHPPGFSHSIAFGVAGDLQVGSGDGRALLWRGSADSVVDLHAFLADLPVLIERSFAESVNERGYVVGVGFGSDGRARAILWVAVPEPSAMTICALGAMGGILGLVRR